MSIQKNHTLLDEVRDVMRLLHYSIRTESSYCDWIKRYVHYHKMTSRDDLQDAESKIEAFLTHLAVDQNLSSSTQNQAMNALVFLYKRVLKHPLDKKINAVRARKKINVPVVMSREEVAKIIALMSGVPQLAVKLLYGSGLRIMEAVRLRIQDIDFEFKQITVRSGKGAKDRVTTCSSSLLPLLQNHLTKVQVLHQEDLAKGYGEVFLPGALARKYRGAARELGWQLYSRPGICLLTLEAVRRGGIMLM
jgi:integron integrase